MHNFDSWEVLPCKITIVHSLIASGHPFIKETKPRKSLECLWKKRTSCLITKRILESPAFTKSVHCNTFAFNISLHDLIICDKSCSLVSSHFCQCMISDMAQDSTMQWLVWFMAQLMAFKLSSCLYQQVMCPAPPYHDKPFPKSGADHESSVIVFSTGVCSEPRFLQNSHVSYLASEYFLGGAVCD